MPKIVVARSDHKSQHVAGLRRASCWARNGALKWRPRGSADTIAVGREMDSIRGQAHPDLITNRDRQPNENRWNLKVGGDLKLDVGHDITPRLDSSTGRGDIDDCHSIVASGRRCRRVARRSTNERDDRKPIGNAPLHVRRLSDKLSNTRNDGRKQKRGWLLSPDATQATFRSGPPTRGRASSFFNPVQSSDPCCAEMGESV